ncbi:hypothetical protein [Aromatoleum evansii]|uniref:hypothetical protein n=1 Tax=Aromatoleum evansii TaxID=59406 RepID=UPI00145D2A15|nr:hypothetical protein [Aromatoleum evansii]NMG29826.1 hypothetical protein [Aromatoleum evansii]
MYKKLVLASLAALLLSACVVAPPRGAVVVAPALPAIVEFDVEPYYYHRGYYYYYENSRWRYASSRSGPWVELPRSHYPREIRFKARREEWRGDRYERFERDDRRRDRDERRWEREQERRRDRDDDRRRDRRGDDGDRPWWDRNDDRN